MSVNTLIKNSRQQKLIVNNQWEVVIETSVICYERKNNLGLVASIRPVRLKEKKRPCKIINLEEI